MIGKVFTSTTPFYNAATRTNQFKKRPVLIIGAADAGDYIVLPVSRVTDRNNLDPVFDIPISPVQYPLIGLTCSSYIRVHKQTTVHSASIGQEIGDLRTNYEEFYLSILVKLEEWNQTVLTNALIA